MGTPAYLTPLGASSYDSYFSSMFLYSVEEKGNDLEQMQDEDCFDEDNSDNVKGTF